MNPASDMEAANDMDVGRPEHLVVAQSSRSRGRVMLLFLTCVALVAVGCVTFGLSNPKHNAHQDPQALKFSADGFIHVFKRFTTDLFSLKQDDPQHRQDSKAPTADFVDVLIQRHGESMNNRGCHVLDTQLTADGVKQAEETHEFLVGNPSLTPNISVSSSLMRAMQTAAISFGRKVYVADFLPEEGWGAAPECKHGSGSCAAQPEQQIEFMNKGRGGHYDDSCKVEGPPTPSVVQFFDWGYLGGKPKDYSANHAFDWNRFLEWLWNHDEVKKLVAQKRAGAPLLISITTHGNVMKKDIFNGGPDIKNTAIYKAKLPLQVEKDTGKVLGFEKSVPNDVECRWRCGADESLHLF